MVFRILVITAAIISGNLAFKYAPKEQEDFDCKIIKKGYCRGTLTVKNENYTLEVKGERNTGLPDSPLTTGCRKTENITVFSNTPRCKKYEFIFRKGDPDVTAWPRSGILPCPLIGYDIQVRAGESCSPHGLVGTCPCNNDCFKVEHGGWEECASQCVGVTGTADDPNRGAYDGWSFQSRASGEFAGNCCCKNIEHGTFRGDFPGSIFGDSKCLGSGKNAASKKKK